MSILQDLSGLSSQFAQFIAEQSHCEFEDPAIQTVIALIEQQQAGNVCLNLEHWANQSLPLSTQQPQINFKAPDLQDWHALLLANSCVGEAGDSQPLILDKNRLYLHRYHAYESNISEQLLNRLSIKPEVDANKLNSMLSLLFGDSDTDAGQKNAAIKAIHHVFCVISGGPGTGKTTTIVKILALLLDQNPRLKIALAAPTGKAAARMSESIIHRISDYPIDESILASIPTEARTIHRLLGYQRNGFKHNKTNPLTLDCLVIDEASMLDQAMTSHLLDALPQNCRLILLGDRDQLASVAAGNVLADITGQASKYSTRHIPPPDIEQSIALLDKSYRFADGAGISSLAKAVNGGEVDSVINLLEQPPGEIEWIKSSALNLEADSIDEQALDWAVQKYLPIFTADNVTDAMNRFDSIRVLTAQHDGNLGVETINRKISDRILARGLISNTDQYRGQPLLISENYYDLKLFNGDTGLIWPDQNGKLKAWFRGADSDLRSISLSLLPQLKTAWAMTVHKAQGSEFKSLLLLVAEAENHPAITRSWLYTAITRAREECLLQVSISSILTICQRMSARQSGLAQRLGWPDH